MWASCIRVIKSPCNWCVTLTHGHATCMHCHHDNCQLAPWYWLIIISNFLTTSYACWNNNIFIHPCEQFLVWFSFEEGHICPISSKCDQMNSSLLGIQRYIFMYSKGELDHIKMHKCIIFWFCIMGVLMSYTPHVSKILKYINHSTIWILKKYSFCI